MTPIIQKFQVPFRDLSEEAIAKCLSLLTMCMYCFDQRIVVHALESFKVICVSVCLCVFGHFSLLLFEADCVCALCLCV